MEQVSKFSEKQLARVENELLTVLSGKKLVFDRNKDEAVFRINPFEIQSMTLYEKKLYALVLMLKQRYSSSHIWDVSYHKLSSETGISYYRLKKYVPILIKKGYATKISKDILLNKLGRNRTRKYAIVVSRKDSFLTVVDKLRLSVLQLNSDQQKYVINQKKHEKMRPDQSFLGFKVEKEEWLSDHVEKHGEVRGSTINYVLSGTRNLGRKLNESHRTTELFLKRAAQRMTIKTNRVIMPIKSFDGKFNSAFYEDYVDGMKGHTYVKGGIIWCDLGTSIQLGDNYTNDTIHSIRRTKEGNRSH
jgi:hypothetical protein